MQIRHDAAKISPCTGEISSQRSRWRSKIRVDICRRIIVGGYPEVLTRETGDRRSAWFRSYLSSLIQRDIRDLSNIDGLTDLPRLLGLIAARSSALMNMSELSRSTGIANSTLRRYLSLLEAIFVLQPLPAWSTNTGKRFVKSPKIHLVDTGLAAHLRGDTDPRSLSQSANLGSLLETFVVQELRKQLTWSKTPATPFTTGPLSDARSTWYWSWPVARYPESRSKLQRRWARRTSPAFDRWLRTPAGNSCAACCCTLVITSSRSATSWPPSPSTRSGPADNSGSKNH